MDSNYHYVPKHPSLYLKTNSSLWFTASITAHWRSLCHVSPNVWPRVSGEEYGLVICAYSLKPCFWDLTPPVLSLCPDTLVVSPQHLTFIFARRRSKKHTAPSLAVKTSPCGEKSLFTFGVYLAQRKSGT